MGGKVPGVESGSPEPAWALGATIRFRIGTVPLERRGQRQCTDGANDVSILMGKRARFDAVDAS